ncbi:hypothetical protein [Psychrobacter sp. I-STPA6b]|uniref:hypothetical protein n=1 Tax=Psychrobacter sp. I-STPA6b TaxID=2585718 RepID=UPI001D0C817A|nr:hypothetical protein [Psychrobacter sp. I-STPA6b]
MRKLSIALLLTLSGCQQTPVDDFVKVSQASWTANTPYPFTTDGEITCVRDAVYFYPDDTANDESQVGQPLNDEAVELNKKAGLTATVPNSIKGSLSDADIQILLGMCPNI